MRSWLPEGFHYFGWWHLFARFLQAIAATFLIRALGYKNFLATFTAVVFALLSPAFNWRWGHTALTTHALILFGFGVYVLGINKKWSLIRSSYSYIFLSIVALLIQPYLFGLIYVIFLAFLIDFGFKNSTFKPCLKFFALSIFLVGCTCFVVGYFSMGGRGDGGYGFFSMNLISPFIGGKFTNWYDKYTMPGQTEGFNYFGVGLMLVLIFVLIDQWSWLQQLPRRFPALTVLMILFWLFALSNIVYFGKYKVIHFQLPHFVTKLTAIYRSGGRMFWPVGYAIMFIGIAGILRSQKSRILVITLLAVALVLQWFDTKNTVDRVREQAHWKMKDMQIWDPLINSMEGIDILPTLYPKECW